MKKPIYKYRILSGTLPEEVVFGVYDRASTKPQGINAARDVARSTATELAEQEGWSLVMDDDNETFLDVGISGDDPYRPAFNRLLKSGVNVIAIRDYDRLARGEETSVYLYSKMKWCDICLIEVTEKDSMERREELSDGLSEAFKKFAIEYAIEQGYIKNI